MTDGADVPPALEESHAALVTRVRARMTRTCDHLRRALVGRDADILTSWDLEPHVVRGADGSEHLTLRGTPGRRAPATLEQWRAALAASRSWLSDLARVYRGELALEDLPLRLTIAESFLFLDREADTLAANIGAEIHVALGLVPPKLRAAVAAREELITRWPWPFDRSPVASVLVELLAMSETLPHGEPMPGTWPPDVAPLDVVTWAEPRLGDALKTVGAEARPTGLAGFRQIAEAGNWEELGHPQWVTLAVLYATVQAVETARRTPVIRHSATKAGRAALSVIAAGGSLNTAHPWRPHDILITESVVELVWDGRRTPVQLRLDLSDDRARLDWVAVQGILRELHEDGLRDWLILHRMAGEQGATGTIRWTWPDHKAQTPYARRVTLGKASDTELAAATVRRLWQLKRAEIRLYAARSLPDGSTPWVRVGPGGLLDIPAGIRDLEGRDQLVVIKLNPAIYEGARAGSPAPHFMLLAESAVNLPGAALRLLSFLACDWQYERPTGGLLRTAATLWEYADISHGRRTERKRWPEAERALERLLATLAAQGHLADWHHAGGEGAERQYLLRPPQWWIDQALLDVPPVFGKSLASTPKTGRELKEWRNRRSLSVAELAKLAEVNPSTIKRAESAPTKPLSPRLVARLRPL